ncbi:hypothetical protein GCM10009677_37950 [Sphaerisporangium rubeum]
MAFPWMPSQVTAEVPVLSTATTLEPSALRNADAFSAELLDDAPSRTAPGRMNLLYPATAHSRLDTLYVRAAVSIWISARVVPAEPPSQ